MMLSYLPDNMVGSLSLVRADTMTDGIEESATIVVFITKRYVEKVRHANPI